jgi:hypothetical protein
MILRRLVVPAAFILVLVIGGVAWHFLAPEPVITEDRVQLIQPGMTEAEVRAILGGPAGDYARGAVVTYARGNVGADESGYYQGTNWWGSRGMIQVQFSTEGLVESASYYPANSATHMDFWDKLWARLTSGGKGNRHGWVAAAW